MMNCDYCGETVKSDSLVEHYAQEHNRDELSQIDRRKVEAEFSKESSSPMSTRVLVLAGLICLAGIGGGVYALIDTSHDHSPHSHDQDVEPGVAGEAHFHGKMEVVLDGQPVDFSREEYQVADERFHFEGGNGVQWHAHANRVSLEYALESFGWEVEADDTLVVNGKRYSSVKYLVNGQEVDPHSYLLQKGDSVEVVASNTTG